MKKHIITLLLLLAGFYQVNAQIHENPVKWTYSSENLGDGEYLLTFNAKIVEENWHIYSAYIDPSIGPYPTAFYYQDSSGMVLPKDYNDTTYFSFVDKLEESEPHVAFDNAFGATIGSFENEATFKQKVRINADGIVTIKGEIEWMVCNDETCLPPELFEFSFELEGENTSTIDKGSIILVFIEGFLGGLVALLMPCIFPMIPLTVSFFTKQSKTKAEGVRKAIIYGVSIITIYVILGLIVTAAFGPSGLNAFATNPWVNVGFFVLFVIFAISFFGAFEITLPSSWVNKADDASNKGGLIGIFFMAFTLALVSFSCTGPIIGSLLVEAATKGSWLGPTVGMFAFALALAIPFTLFAIFPGWLNSMPKSGGWLNTVKVTLGFLELAFAFKFLSSADLVWQTHFLEREMFIAIWVAIIFILVLYLLGVFLLPLDSKTERISVSRLLFAMFFTILGFYLLPGIWGAPVKLISGFPPPEFYAESPGGAFNSGGGHAVTINPDAENHNFGQNCPHNLNCFNDYDEGLAYAKEVNKPILLDFTGWGCVNCRRMEENVWVDPAVHKLLAEDYVLISLYVDSREKLPKNEQRVSDVTGKKIKTLGNKWSDFQTIHFKANAQPYYVVVGHDNLNPLISTRAFDLDIPAYMDWLDSGIEVFNK